MRYMRRRRNNLLLVTFLILAVFAWLYFFTADSQTHAAQETLYIKDVFSITEADRYVGTENAEELTLDQHDGDLLINQGGRYLLRGDLQGTLYIDAEDQLVHLILDNASIVGNAGPAISVLSAGKVFLTSLENTSNSIGDAALYLDTNTETACIYSTSDLTINGTGQLLITGLREDAVYCRDTLKILCSNLQVQSKRDCLRGNDGVLIQGSDIRLEAERNGIRTTNSGNDGRGDVEIRGADLSVIAGNYCVNSASDFYVQESQCFFKGILGVYSVAGEALVDEGSLADE